MIEGGDDTVRLLLMDNPDMTLRELHEACRAELPGWSHGDTEQAWSRYRGWDGRTSPTHDVETGRPRW